jgi:hypothetical protein
VFNQQTSWGFNPKNGLSWRGLIHFNSTKMEISTNQHGHIMGSTVYLYTNLPTVPIVDSNITGAPQRHCVVARIATVSR